MRLESELLELSVHLSKKEPRQPRQASLRRAVSTAYYALFHLLVREASTLLAPPNPPHLRPLLARAFQHGDMLVVSKAFGVGGTLAQHHSSITPSPDLRLVATVFVTLQQARHEADYDLTARFTRVQVDSLLKETEAAFQAWNRVRKSDDARTYLTALLAERRWKR